MTSEEKRKAEKVLNNYWKKLCDGRTSKDEIMYMSARNLIGSMGLFWHRDKLGKHHIF